MPILDITSGLNNDVLITINERVNLLVALKNKFLSEGKLNIVQEIDTEKTRLINAVKTYKENLANEILNIKSASLESINSDNKTEYLNLSFDPTVDYNDMKNITITVKTEEKITDITLVDYMLTRNENNITRFNNRFVVYFNNRLTRVIIPPGKYSINSILEYIKAQMTFIDFSINEDNIITIRNTLNMKFDIMPETDNIFTLLGFTSKMDSYKDKIYYAGTVPYNINGNDKVFFSLAGSTMEPIELELDKKIEINKSIKKSRSGIMMKKITLSFTDSISQCYDFTVPFSMCLKITRL